MKRNTAITTYTEQTKEVNMAKKPMTDEQLLAKWKKLNDEAQIECLLVPAKYSHDVMVQSDCLAMPADLILHYGNFLMNLISNSVRNAADFIEIEDEDEEGKFTMFVLRSAIEMCAFKKITNSKGDS